MLWGRPLQGVIYGQAALAEYDSLKQEFQRYPPYIAALTCLPDEEV
ncbi:MAG: hypothetical protein ACI9OO_001557 [Bacteroidia bacterium]|jgi:hypothetical protein